ncbi:MAG: hypothetical protein MK008_06115 [Bdellovibrionales bacterium]|nr:hypothetical protein [Bdellovibrionales bacterium]
MKFLNLILLVLLLSWSWAVIQKKPLMHQEIHYSIQTELKTLIETSIKSQLPSAQNVQFTRFWTESLGNKKMKASFLYSFEDSAAEVTEQAQLSFEGYAILNRSTESSGDENVELWNLDELKIENNTIEYNNGVVITPGDDEI